MRPHVTPVPNSTFIPQPSVVPTQQLQPSNQRIPVRGESIPSSQSWPKMTQFNIQRYTKVFVKVDTDRDGKITGEQAHSLFLSWELPKDILKQVWDLSDQDNDSMLSLTEFCIALFLMERHREGHPLPKVLPAGIMFDPGVQQVPRMMTRPAVRPPRPVPVPVDEEMQQPKQQKPEVPVLEKHLVDQLSNEEQSSLNSKLHEATEADKKVGELEKEILKARQKIEFYRNKMQEIVLYKSRCDSRLNEIIERVCGDRKEVESLSKKYEDKYKQAGDVASKLTIEEASFRDIQEKKMEIYQAIVKLDQGGKTDDIQGLVDSIQEDLEVQVKTLNERCKMYGLRGKPTLLFELPFGWQGGIQEGAADWDENWDKFEDEGFTFVKDLTLDVKNVIAPPKQKSMPLQDKSESSTIGANEPVNQYKGKIVKSPPDSPTFNSNYDSEAAWDITATNHKDFDNESVNGITNTLFGSSSDSWNRGGLNPIKTEIPKFTFDSIPGTPAYSFTFDNSVPSTPLSEDHSFNNKFSRFDSFSSISQDSEVDQGFFPPQKLTRSDSMHSTADSDFGHLLFQPRDSFSRFDSMRSIADSNHGFPSFDDADLFGSHNPLKSERPRRDSVDSWKAF